MRMLHYARLSQSGRKSKLLMLPHYFIHLSLNDNIQLLRICIWGGPVFNEAVSMRLYLKAAL